MEKDLLQIRQLINLRKFDLAEKRLKDYLANNPEDAYAIGLLSMCYYFLQNFPKGIELAERAISIDPVGFEQPYIILGFIYSDLRKIKLSEKYTSQGLKLFPFEHRFFIVKSQNEMFENNYKKAEKYALQGLDIAPQNVFLLNLKANALSHRKKTNEAEKVLNLALNFDPLNPETLKNKGWIALENNQYKKAKAFFLDSLRQNASDSETQYGFKLSLLSKYKWMRFSLKILLYLRKFGNLILVGIIAGIAPQLGKLIMNLWESPSLFNPLFIFFIGFVLILGTFFLSYFLAIINIQNDKINKKYFHPSEIRFAKKLVISYFVILLFFIFAIVKINS